MENHCADHEAFATMIGVGRFAAGAIIFLLLGLFGTMGMLFWKVSDTKDILIAKIDGSTSRITVVETQLLMHMRKGGPE